MVGAGGAVFMDDTVFIDDTVFRCRPAELCPSYAP
jgi:hypothetical protein